MGNGYPVKVTLKQPLTASQVESILADFEDDIHVKNANTILNTVGDEVFFEFGNQDADGNFHSFTLNISNTDFSNFLDLFEKNLDKDNQILCKNAIDLQELNLRSYNVEIVGVYLDAIEKIQNPDGYGNTISPKEGEFFNRLVGIFDPEAQYADDLPEDIKNTEAVKMYASSIYGIKQTAFENENMFSSSDFAYKIYALHNLFTGDMPNEIADLVYEYESAYGTNAFYGRHSKGIDEAESKFSYRIRDVFKEHATAIPPETYDIHYKIIEILNEEGNQLKTKELRQALEDLLEKTPESIQSEMKEAFKL